jgi:hypothetical protein
MGPVRSCLVARRGWGGGGAGCRWELDSAAMAEGRFGRLELKP